MLDRFEYRPGKAGNQEPESLTAMREQLRETAKAILANTPEGREQSLAVTQLEQAYMWAVAAYCRSRNSED